jgi:hypothetical protein
MINRIFIISFIIIFVDILTKEYYYTPFFASAEKGAGGMSSWETERGRGGEFRH